jgi:hypothetical protein
LSHARGRPQSALQELGLTGLLLIIALVVTFLLVRNWPAITGWLEERWRARHRHRR